MCFLFHALISFKLPKNDPTGIEEEDDNNQMCNEILNEKVVHYFSGKERAYHEVYITPSEDGKKLIWRYKRNNELVLPSSMNNPHMYAWGIDKKFYIVDKNNTLLYPSEESPSVVPWDTVKRQTIKHSSIFAGGPVMSAGEAHVDQDGAVLGINFASGHYRPNIQTVTMMYQSFKDQHFNTAALRWAGRLDWSEEDCDNAKWEENEISGFNAASLEKSCHEITNSPTFVLKDDDDKAFAS